MTLHDLHVLMADAGRYDSVISLLRDKNRLQQMSEDGHEECSPVEDDAVG